MTELPQLPCARVAAHGGNSCAPFASRLVGDHPSDVLSGASCLFFSTRTGLMMDLPQLPCARVVAHGGSSCVSFAS